MAKSEKKEKKEKKAKDAPVEDVDMEEAGADEAKVSAEGRHQEI